MTHGPLLSCSIQSLEKPIIQFKNRPYEPETRNPVNSHGKNFLKTDHNRLLFVGLCLCFYAVVEFGIKRTALTHPGRHPKDNPGAYLCNHTRLLDFLFCFFQFYHRIDLIGFCIGKIDHQVTVRQGLKFQRLPVCKQSG
jgi:hypothetical protein